MSTPEDLGLATRLFDGEDAMRGLGAGFGTGTSGDSSEATHDKPTHYKVICISMYTETLGKLDGMVKELKKRGYTKANRSALLRHALELVDLDAVPRGL